MRRAMQFDRRTHQWDGPLVVGEYGESRRCHVETWCLDDWYAFPLGLERVWVVLTDKPGPRKYRMRLRDGYVEHQAADGRWEFCNLGIHLRDWVIQGIREGYGYVHLEYEAGP